MANTFTGACALEQRLSCSVFGAFLCEAHHAANLFQKSSA